MSLLGSWKDLLLLPLLLLYIFILIENKVMQNKWINEKVLIKEYDFACLC